VYPREDLFLLSVLVEGKSSMRSHSLRDVQVCGGGGGVGKLISNQLRLFVGIVGVFFFCVVACWAVIQTYWYYENQRLLMSTLQRGGESVGVSERVVYK
jgi:hypothetical protein